MHTSPVSSEVMLHVGQLSVCLYSYLAILLITICLHCSVILLVVFIYYYSIYSIAFNN